MAELSDELRQSLDVAHGRLRKIRISASSRESSNWSAISRQIRRVHDNRMRCMPGDEVRLVVER
jgi:hypothetical protein